MKELFKISTIKDTVGSRLRVVNNEFVLSSSSLSSGGLGLREKKTRHKPTEKGTQQSSTGETDHSGVRRVVVLRIMGVANFCGLYS